MTDYPIPKKQWPWLCRLLGHRFKKGAGGYVYSSNRCWRCGFPLDWAES